MIGNLSERSKSWFVKLILVLLSIPFALFGVDYYARNSGGKADAVAKVAGESISQGEFSQQFRQQLDQMRGMIGKDFDTAMFDTPQMRSQVLDSMVNQKLLMHQARSLGMVLTDAQLRDRIGAIEAFNGDDGKFSQTRYEQLLRAQGMSPAMFEARMRQDGLVQTMRDSLTESVIVPKTAIDAYIRANDQQREVSQVTFKVDEFMTQVKLAPEAVKAFYDGHPDEFKIPEQVKLDYVVLSSESIMSGVQATPEEVEARYKERLGKGSFQQKEERQASHILVTVDPKADEAARKAAKEKAEALFQQAKAVPDKFAELAEKNSQDPGSAKQGGDLGFFGRGAMAKPFEDAVFGMQQGEIRGPIQTDFGWHVIKLAAIKAEKTRSLAEASPEITEEIRKEKAARLFAESAEKFSNLAYEQSGSVKPAADAFKLEVKHSGWVSRNGAENDPLLNNAKLLQAVFAQDVLKDKRNTSAIEVGPNLLVAARVTDYKAAAPRPFADAKPGIELRLTREEAFKLAVKKGGDTLALLQQGKAPEDLKWSEPKLITRTAQSDLPAPVQATAFKVDTQKLPAYTGEQVPNLGYVLAKVGKIVEPPAPDDAKRKSTAKLLQDTLAQDEFAATLASLRKSTEITVKKELIERTEK